MTSRFSKTPEARQVDPALIGTWTSPAGTIAVTPDGWLLVLGDSVAVIGPGGTVLTDNGTVFTRVYGTASGIEGVWQSTQTDGGILWTEDRHYRPDGTYTIQWTADGAFDSVHFGEYTWRNDVLAIRERRALVSTSAPDVIALDLPFSSDIAGQYAVTAGGQLELTFDGVTTVYDPA